MQNNRIEMLDRKISELNEIIEGKEEEIEELLVKAELFIEEKKQRDM